MERHNNGKIAYDVQADIALTAIKFVYRTWVENWLVLIVIMTLMFS